VYFWTTKKEIKTIRASLSQETAFFCEEYIQNEEEIFLKTLQEIVY